MCCCVSIATMVMQTCHNATLYADYVSCLYVVFNLLQRLTAVGIRCADRVTPLYQQKLALASLTGGGRSVSQDPVGL